MDDGGGRAKSPDAWRLPGATGCAKVPQEGQDRPGDNGRGGGSMTDTTEAENDKADPPQPRQRRPWHAPSFVRLETSDTDINSHGGSDGGSLGSPS
jgi:hypothetical protein